MEYLGKKLQAGPAGTRFLNLAWCERETREHRECIETLSSDLGPKPGLKYLSPAAEINALLAGLLLLILVTPF